VELIGKAVDHVMVSGLVAKELRSFYAIWRQIPAAARVNNQQKLSLAEMLKPWCRGANMAVVR
jgi:type IV secretion system protein VirB4